MAMWDDLAASVSVSDVQQSRLRRLYAVERFDHNCHEDSACRHAGSMRMLLHDGGLLCHHCRDSSREPRKCSGLASALVVNVCPSTLAGGS